MFADEIQLMRFNLSNGEIGLTTDNYAKGKTIKETIPADCDARLIIGFKADHFLDCLSAYKNEKATMTFSDTQHPVLLLDENEPDKRIILMPVVLNG
jgi:DNA polymerase III sliding clamp (beta) subunit (PCNA family)